jgi:hypothetical protein
MKNIFVLTAICSMIGSAALAQTSAPAAPQPVAPKVSQDIAPAPTPQPAQTERKANQEAPAAESTKSVK